MPAVPIQDQYRKLGGCASKYSYLVGVRTASGRWGSGILIDAYHVLTCEHVVRDSTSIQVVFQKGQIVAEEVKLDESWDLALLKLMRPLSIPPAKFTDATLRTKMNLLAAGVQEGLGDPGALWVAETKLTFLNENGADGKILDIQLTGAARPGYSGGPLVLKQFGRRLCVGVLSRGGHGTNTIAIGLAPILDFMPVGIDLIVVKQAEVRAARRFLLWATSLAMAIIGAIGRSHLLAFVICLIGHADCHARVWVNTQSKIYHCPGTSITKQGEFMTQVEALEEWNRPARWKLCK